MPLLALLLRMYVLLYIGSVLQDELMVVLLEMLLKIHLTTLRINQEMSKWKSLKVTEIKMI